MTPVGIVIHCSDSDIPGHDDISVISYNIGEVKAQLKQLKETENKVEGWKEHTVELVKTLQATNDKQAQYKKLQTAFGKKGIQAYIIENCIPEVQATTNDILSGLDTGIRIILIHKKI